MRTRLGVVLIVAAVAVPLAIVSVAFACGRLATLYLNHNSARQGAHLLAVGQNYNTAPNASQVELRLNSRSGRVLWTGRPDVSATIHASFTVPNVRSGQYVVLALQNGPTGVPAAGTPGRAPLRIGRPRHRAAGAWLASPPSFSSRSGGGSHAIITPERGLLAGLISGPLLAAGLALLASERRRRQASSGRLASSV